MRREFPTAENMASFGPTSGHYLNESDCENKHDVRELDQEQDRNADTTNLRNTNINSDSNTNSVGIGRKESNVADCLTGIAYRGSD